MKTILPGQTIGIIGGGQLGRMMAIAAREMGFHIAVLDPTENCPCAGVADTHIVASYSDLSAIRQLAKVSDVLTYEFENIDYQCLAWVEENAYLPQGSQLLLSTQNRLTEKQAITDVGIPVAPYCAIKTEQDLLEAIEKLGYPCVLKTTTGGYDGKGQVVLKSEADLEAAHALLAGQPCVLEAWIPFEKEISVIIVRNHLGQMNVFPISENVHVENILHQSIVPARISETVSEQAILYAEQLATSFSLIGTLAVEMFVTATGKIYINELAPRPHNSGHYTLDACSISQFEQHIRAVCGWPLADVQLYTETVMVNVLGQHLEKVLEKIPLLSNCQLHLYGKKDAVYKRKMGHINVVASSIEEALTKVHQLDIWEEKQ